MRKKGICVLFALVTVFSTLMAAGQQEAAKVDENGLPIVKMAMCPGLPGMPVMYLAETGLDEKYGFKADTEFYSSGIPMNEALAAGLWDVGTIGAAAVTSLAEYGGVLVTDLTAGLPGMAMLAPVDSKIAHTVGYSPDCPEVFGSADTVRGKTILTVRGAMMHYLALLYLEEIGLTEDDVNLVHMEMGQLRTAFESGQADMASMSPPAATFELLENGFAADCATFQTLNNPQQEVLIANGDFYKEDPELLVKVVAAMIEAQDKLSADYALQEEWLKKYYSTNGLNVTDDAIKKEVGDVMLTSEEKAAGPCGGFTYNLARFNASNGMLDESKLPTVESNITQDILQSALALYSEKK